MDHKTEQEAFWLGEFGEAYRERNRGHQLTARKAAFFATALKGASNVGSVCEFGCNIGLNLSALASLNDLQLTGVEINPGAAAEAQELGVADIKVASVLDDLSAYGQFDLTFTMGVLIHINPDYLKLVYQNLVTLSRRYVLVCEYYNPAPVTVPYRGHQERLFKRDFAGELMDEFGLELVDYGFVYRRDNHAAMDDFTWFLLRKGG